MERISVRLTMDVIPEEHLNYFKMKGLKLAVKEGDGIDKAFHYHMFFEGTHSTLKKYFQRHVTGGNKVWSMKKCDGDWINYLRYCCKGDGEGIEPRVLLSDGYDIKKLQQEFYDAQKEFKAELKETLKKRKRVHNTLEECWEFVQGENTVSADPVSIGCSIMKWYHQNNLRQPLSHAMHSMIITYMYRFNCTAIVKIDERDMFRRCYPNLNL